MGGGGGGGGGGKNSVLKLKFETKVWKNLFLREPNYTQQSRASSTFSKVTRKDRRNRHCKFWAMLFVKDFVARFDVKSNSFSFPLFQISCSCPDNPAQC